MGQPLSMDLRSRLLAAIDDGMSCRAAAGRFKARADPEHPDHADIREWLDGYDPDELDLFPIKVALGRVAARRNAAAKRIIKPAND